MTIESGGFIHGRGGAIAVAKQTDFETQNVTPADFSFIHNFINSEIALANEVDTIDAMGRGAREMDDDQFIGRSSVGGSISSNLYPEALKFIAFCLGLDTTTAISSDGDANGHNHELSIGKLANQQPPPLTIQQRMGDPASTFYKTFTGMHVDSFTLNFQERGVVTLDINFMGDSEKGATGLTQTTVSYIENDPFLATSVKFYLPAQVGNTALGSAHMIADNELEITDFTFTFSNNGELVWQNGSGNGINPKAYEAGKPTAEISINKKTKSSAVIEASVTDKDERSLIIDIKTPQKTGTANGSENQITILCPKVRFQNGGEQTLNNGGILSSNPTLKVLRSYDANNNYALKINQKSSQATAY